MIKDKRLDGAIIAISTEDDYEVLWPDDFQGGFSLL
jgi:hypothetical protein